MLFQYGVRINQDLVQDLASMSYPVVTGNLNGRPRMTPLEWPFFPLANHYADHPITRNLDATALRFVSSIDSVKATGIRKTPLVFTSSNSRRLKAPVSISVNNLRKELKPENFSSGPIPVAYLLEGKFTSLYKNRFLPEGIDSAGFKTEGMRTRLIVVSDGDLPRNDFNLRSGRPFELGFDNLTGHTYANKELIMNMVSFLTDETGLINARNKEVKMRPLNKEKIRNERAWWQAVNLVFPVALLALFGLIKVYLRKRKYERFDSAT